METRKRDEESQQGTVTEVTHICLLWFILTPGCFHVIRSSTCFGSDSYFVDFDGVMVVTVRTFRKLLIVRVKIIQLRIYFKIILR